MDKKRILILLFIFISALSLAGCTRSAGEDGAFVYERPAVGPQVEDETATDVELSGQSRLDLEAADGVIKLSYWDKDYLQAVVRKKVKGPASEGSLKELLEDIDVKIESLSYEIKITAEQNGKIKPLFRGTADIELKVPAALKNINIKANNGAIIMSGLSGLNSADIEVKKGNIKADGCAVGVISAETGEGNIDFDEIEGSGEYKCGRGDVRLNRVNGDIKLKLTAGNAYIENADGKLDCDISSGKLSIKGTHLKADTILYASRGKIEAGFSRIDTSGKYTIKSAGGDIRLDLPKSAGWSLLAESTGGRVVNNTGLGGDVLKSSPTGEVYGDFEGGGPSIDVYTDSGDISLNMI